MSDDLTHAHAARLHRDDFFVEALKAPLIFGDQPRVEARLSISRNIRLEAAGVGHHRFLAIAAAGVAAVAVHQMMIHLMLARIIEADLMTCRIEMEAEDRSKFGWRSSRRPTCEHGAFLFAFLGSRETTIRQLPRDFSPGSLKPTYSGVWPVIEFRHIGFDI